MIGGAGHKIKLPPKIQDLVSRGGGGVKGRIKDFRKHGKALARLVQERLGISDDVVTLIEAAVDNVAGAGAGAGGRVPPGLPGGPVAPSGPSDRDFLAALSVMVEASSVPMDQQREVVTTFEALCGALGAKGCWVQLPVRVTSLRPLLLPAVGSRPHRLPGEEVSKLSEAVADTVKRLLRERAGVQHAAAVGEAGQQEEEDTRTSSLYYDPFAAQVTSYPDLKHNPKPFRHPCALSLLKT